MRLLLLAFIRELRRRSTLTLLSIAGIVAGVAVTVAMDVANRGVGAAFDRAIAELNGRATHFVEGRSGRIANQAFPEVLRAWRLQQGDWRRFGPPTPVVTESVRLVAGTEVLRARLLGLDLIAGATLRDYGDDLAASGVSLAELITTPAGVLVGEDLVSSLGLQPDAELILDGPAGRRSLRLMGTVPGAQNLVLADIAVAQELLGRLDAIDRIDLRLRQEARVSGLRALFASSTGRYEPPHLDLPATLRLVPLEDWRSETLGLADAFRFNLGALSLLALVAGGFLIFNGERFLVQTRQPLFARLRALGLLPRDLATLILIEALLLGILGSLLGIGLGVLLGEWLLWLIVPTVAGLFFEVAGEAAYFRLADGVQGLLLGLLITLLASWQPARQAYRPPSARPPARDPARRGLLSAGSVLILVVALLWGLWAEPSIAGGFLTMAAALLLSIVVLLLLLPTLGSFRGLTLPRHAPLLVMVLRDVTRRRSRFIPALAAMLVVIQTSLGMDLMIDSFRKSLDGWLDRRLDADFYVRRWRDLDALQASLQASGLVHSVDLGTDFDLWSQSYLLRATVIADAALEGGYFGALAPPRTNQVLISEPLAKRLRIGAGDLLPLGRSGELGSHPVAGVFRDYGAGKGRVVMSEHLAASMGLKWEWRRAGIRLRSSVNRAVARAQLAELLEPGGADLMDSTEIRELGLQVFDAVFAITSVLRYLALGVAVLGVYLAIQALQFERRFDFGVLRALGVRRLGMVCILVGYGLIVGLLIGFFALPGGVLLVWILVARINPGAFGWSMDFALSLGALVRAPLLAPGAGMLAAVPPALRFARSKGTILLRRATWPRLLPFVSSSGRGFWRQVGVPGGAVSSQLHVSLSAWLAGSQHRAFPVFEQPLKALIRHHSFDMHGNVFLRRRQMPGDRPAAALGRFPVSKRLQFPVPIAQEGCGAIGGNDHSVPERPRALVSVADLKGHQVATVIKLQSEPVPSDLIGLQQSAAPFPIQPSISSYLDGAIQAGQVNFSHDRQPG